MSEAIRARGCGCRRCVPLEFRAALNRLLESGQSRESIIEECTAADAARGQGFAVSLSIREYLMHGFPTTGESG